MARIRRIHETTVGQYLLQMTVEMLKVLCGGQRRFRFVNRRRPIQCRHPQLVGEDLHGHRQIERTETGVGWDRQQCVAAIEIVVGQPGLFRPENGSNLASLAFFQ